MHDADERRHPAGALHGQGAEIAVEDLVGNLQNGLVRRLDLLHQVQHAADVQGAEDQVDVRRPLQNFSPGALRDAAAHADHHARALLLEATQATQFTVKLLLRLLADAAGVHQHQVGLLRVRREFVAALPEHPGHALRIVHVHLAAVGDDGKFLRRSTLVLREGLGRGNGLRCHAVFLRWDVALYVARFDTPLHGNSTECCRQTSLKSRLLKVSIAVTATFVSSIIAWSTASTRLSGRCAFLVTA